MTLFSFFDGGPFMPNCDGVLFHLLIAVPAVLISGASWAGFLILLRMMRRLTEALAATEARYARGGEGRV